MRWLLEDKRIVLSLGLMALTAALFWAGSRYPALNEKALMAGTVNLPDPISFEVLQRTQPDDPFIRRVAATTVNWVYTNHKGMFFGVLFAAVFLTLLPLFQRRSFRSGVANSLFGVTIGTPLGVCVNCAAPVAAGLHAAGARLETSLAAMVSSPTLNIVVLTMLFSLFPFYMGLLKLGATLLFILVVIPLLCRFLFKDERLAFGSQAPAADPAGGHDQQAPDSRSSIPPNGWGEALNWIARKFPRNLWFVLKTTAPLMLLAGFLGAVAITLLPWEDLVGTVDGLTRWQKLLSLGLVALFGLFLPVPIAFDIYLCSTLLSAGAPPREVMVLLFTLGIFSVYGFVIVGRVVSWRIAMAMSVVLLGLSVASGVGAHYLDPWYQERQARVFWQAFSQLQSQHHQPSVPRPKAEDDRRLVAQLRRQALVYHPFPTIAPAGIRVERLDLKPREARGGRLFVREDSTALGFHEPAPRTLVSQFLQPFTMLRGIAAGDVHGDGWEDFVIGSDHGISLYANTGGERFTLQRIAIPRIQGLYVAAVALIDLDNDGWLDIFLSTVRHGNFVIYNREGSFSADNLHALPRGAATVATAVAFGDLERDGALDVMLGNWSSGIAFLSPADSRNVILRSGTDGFQPELLPGRPGETLSTLLTDINHDGHLDLMVGNDFDEPDVFYLNDGKGALRAIRAHEDLFPLSTYYTMSLDSADINNDLDLDIYVGQVSLPATDELDRLSLRSLADLCDDHVDPQRRARCQATVRLHEATSDLFDPEACLGIVEDHHRLDCLAVKLFYWAQDRGDVAHCDLLPERWSDVAHLCRYLSPAGSAVRAANDPDELPQDGDRNVLLVQEADGHFTNRAAEMGVDIAGWTWNAKFADLDNDEWQDLYVVNGYYSLNLRESNMFFRNLAGRQFEDATVEAGLTDSLATGAYVYVDFDHDGDLDIVTLPFDGPVRVFRNRLARGQAIVIELRDGIGNRFGVGSKILIHYSRDRHQIREIKASGGFLSFDPMVAHFGMGEHRRVDRIEIRWSTGEQTELRGPFPVGARYRITRVP